MKKMICYLLITSLCFALAACSTNLTGSENSSLSETLPVTSNSPTTTDTEKSSLFGDVSDYSIDNPITYQDAHFKFSVDYPSDWKTAESQWWPATSDSEASPDSGIIIYIEDNDNENIYVFGQEGPVSGNITSPQENFVTLNMVQGKLSFTKIDNEYEIWLVLGEGRYGAIIHVSEACFTRNKAQILGILKSIKIS